MACLLDLLSREKELTEEAKRYAEEIDSLVKDIRNTENLLAATNDKLRQTRGFIKKYFEKED